MEQQCRTVVVCIDHVRDVRAIPPCADDDIVLVEMNPLGGGPPDDDEEGSVQLGWFPQAHGLNTALT